MWNPIPFLTNGVHIVKYRFKKHLPFLLGAALFFFLSFLMGGCPFLQLTGVPCPTCGVTRAILCLLRWDWEGYLFYQPMALPLVVSVLLLLHSSCISGRCLRRVLSALSLIVVLSNLCLYFSALFRLYY